ncbi:MAG TPA: nicotinate-nucleotide--dimethylbenzimidazole phosphoribosyltransferase [Gaiellaceae bacterium]|nr:nicotinate-nucleotide--dimethylbenzimidazole phosphoribosyltransferase [Gaiellaceae bacterium]
MSFERPALPGGFDDSRARARRDDPAGWAFSDEEQAAVARAIAERRDIRRFRPDPLPDGALDRLFDAAHRAPSVGLMQPWRFVVVTSDETKAAMQALAARERLVQGERFDERTRQFLDLKIEGIREAPVSVCVCCDRGPADAEVLGRGTIRDTDLYSTSCAIQNLWLAARAEGIGVGWVSFYREEDVQALLGLPPEVVPVAWLCIGYPDERPVRPGLEAAGWSARRPVGELVFHERWGARLEAVPDPAAPPVAPAPSAAAPAWWRRLAAGIEPGTPEAAVAVRDASDELVKPAGSLGALETALERLAAATGEAPRTGLTRGVLVFAADHGVAERGVSLFPGRVSAEVAAAAARGETAVAVLARALDAELAVVDVGLRGAPGAGLVDRRVAAGSGDLTTGPALDPDELERAVTAGYEETARLAERCELLAVGEIGIGNTTVASTLLAALTGLPPDAVCGRGTGLDAQGLERKRAVVAAALAANAPDPADPLECLRRVGGLDLAAIVGALLAAATARRPVVLDGFAVGVAALVAVRLEPSVRDYLLAGHRSAEPAHARVLVELGLEPLLDLRLRLGEASGALLALPLLELASRLHAEMGTFGEAGVTRA